MTKIPLIRKSTNSRSLFIYPICFFISLWLIISIVRLIYNISRIPSEDLRWVKYNEYQKKEALYGDIYDVIIFINSNYPQSKSVLLIADDGKPFFIARYVLYPRRIYWDKIEDKIIQNKDNYSLIVNFQPKESGNKQSRDFIEKISRNKKIVEVKKNNIVIAYIYI